MAMNKTDLKNELVQTALNVIDPDPEDEQAVEDTWETIGAIISSAVIDHIQTNAEVPQGIDVEVDPDTGEGETTEDGEVQ